MTEKKSTAAAAAKGAEKIAARKAKKAAKAADPERIAKKEALARSKKKATKRNADKIAEANAAEAAAAKGGKAAKALTQAEQTALEIKTIVQAAEDKKAKRIVSMDLRGIGTSICDYFVICNADSTTNVLAIADNIADELIV
ncbi:MAG: RsfS/YbeB/iojap family protein, partial [Candidatus Egerieousia sp.]|nr:RsfS/YbeB/iojap family protein [Candidatus Egerieousia sp.]